MWLSLLLVARAEALVVSDSGFPEDTGPFGSFQVALELRAHLSPGRRPLGLSAGLGLDWLLSEGYDGLVIGPHLEARWSRLSYGSFSAFGRAGYCFEVWDNYNNVFISGFSASVEAGYTWRTDYRQAPRVGIIGQIPYLSLSYDQLIRTDRLEVAATPGGLAGRPLPVEDGDPDADLDADPDADPDVPLPTLRGRVGPLTDPTVSLGVMMPTLAPY